MTDFARSARKQGFNRRRFFKTSGAALGIAGLAGLSAASDARTAAWASERRVKIARNDVIVFQGASVTDAGRKREKAATPNEQTALGTGYVSQVAAALLVDRPGDGLKFFNRGVSGNKVFQLAERWQEDCLDLKPNVLSILIGINDFWHTLDPKQPYNGTVEIYERDYMALVERTVKALPKVKLIIGEPAIIKGGAEHWAVNERWFPEFGRYQAAAARVARKFEAAFIRYQAVFDEAVKFAAPEFWFKDGVHPQEGGGAPLMAHAWLKMVK